VIKALPVAARADLDAADAYAGAADMLLFDAKPPSGSGLPGGNGAAFDWPILSGRRFARPWLLSGGLTPENVREAITAAGAAQVDTSSGVESAPGVKDLGRIAAFLAAARQPPA
jgi:phosphoribosylanthranilate isomerase